MGRSKNLQRCFYLLGGGLLAAVIYFFAVTLPLILRERELENALTAAVERLASAGHGMNTGEVMANMARIERDIAVFAEIGEDKARTIRFSSEMQELLDRPFQLLDFDHGKFMVVDRIRRLSRENGVGLFPGWERRFPVPNAERHHLLWTQLVVMDQLIRTAIEAKVQRIDDVRLLPVQGGGGANGTPEGPIEISAQIRLTGKMEAIHSVLMMLPLNDDELETLGVTGFVEPKSSFFLSRFILRKTSTENPDEVSLEFVARGFLDLDARS